MRKLALAHPGTEERAHGGHPDFRIVGGKVFASLSADGKRGMVKLTPEIQTAIASETSGAFAPASGAWGRSGYTMVELGLVELGALEAMVAEAWRLAAPKQKAPAKKAPAKAKQKSATRAKKARKKRKKTTKRA
jgi:hypothetical protein